jgi:predicted transcriptional regulator
MTDRDSQLQQIIEENPGIQFREIMRSSGLKNGVLSHYLGKLEKSGKNPNQLFHYTYHKL